MSAKKSTLVMWSAGIDSTYMLAHLLKETNDDIHAHHVVIKNSDNRYLAEVETIKKLGPKLQAIRKFGFTHSTVDHLAMKALPWDMQVVGFEAGVVSRNMTIGYNRPFNRWTIGTHQAEGHWKARFEKIEACTAAVTWPYDPPTFWLPENLATKSEEIIYLDKMNLLSDCWYCRYPVKKDNSWELCGKCKTCKEVQDALKEAGMKSTDGSGFRGTVESVRENSPIAQNAEKRFKAAQKRKK